MSVTTKRDMAKYKRYEAYISSRIEWLDEAPSHWMISRSDAVLDTERTQLALDFFADKEVFHYSIPAVQQYGTGLVENGEDVGSSKQRITEPVLLVSRLNPRKATICWARPQKEFTIASTEFVALKPRKCEGRFLEYLVNSENYRQRLDSWVQSATKSHQRVRPELIYKFWGAWPPIGEQRAIADFLDCKTALIDEVIAKKQKLIELLKEKRQALITQAVTKGLDPNAKLKPSGIEWLGDIPEGWEVKRLRYVARINPSKSEVSSLPSETEVTFLPMESVSEDGAVSMEHAKRLEEVINGYTYFRDGDVVVAKITPCFENGKGALVRGLRSGLGFGSTEFHVLRPNGIDSRFLYLLTTTTPFRNIGEGEMKGAAGQKRVPEDFVKDFKFGLPSQREQGEIVSYLERAMGKLDQVLTKVHGQIDKLREYRQALITSAVTGKIDVSMTEARIE